MQWKIPKNTKEFYWTSHAIFKMRCYGLGVQKVLGVIRKPQRKEEGIVKNTIAVMQPINPKIQNGRKAWKQEVWVMYQACRAGNLNDQITRLDSRRPLVDPPRLGEAGARRANPKQILNSKFKIKNTRYQILHTKYKIISAWRYPGVSPQKNPIPEEILRELNLN